VVKSIMSALVGIALYERHIASLDDMIVDYVPPLAGSGYDGVTIRDALTMSSGVDFDEDYANPLSDINRLVVTLGFRSLPDILADLERARSPGTVGNYVSSDTIALGLVLEAATGLPNEEYLATRLWQPMGAEADALWNFARGGRVLPFCCLNATLRDYARFGRLFLEGGSRGPRQIVPRDWIEVSTRPTAPAPDPVGGNDASAGFRYGYHWWIPSGSDGVQGAEVMAIGIWGQYIYLDRTREIVIVKTSADQDFGAHDTETVAMFRAIAAHVAKGNL
jgi:CubicO group peptidase (beta-lactamase class C family)